jgi:hypothetical protein
LPYELTPIAERIAKLLGSGVAEGDDDYLVFAFVPLRVPVRFAPLKLVTRRQAVGVAMAQVAVVLALGERASTRKFPFLIAVLASLARGVVGVSQRRPHHEGDRCQTAHRENLENFGHIAPQDILLRFHENHVMT